jgi:hypothetical protein
VTIVVKLRSGGLKILKLRISDPVCPFGPQRSWPLINVNERELTASFKTTFGGSIPNTEVKPLRPDGTPPFGLGPVGGTELIWAFDLTGFGSSGEPRYGAVSGREPLTKSDDGPLADNNRWSGVKGFPFPRSI